MASLTPMNLHVNFDALVHPAGHLTEQNRLVHNDMTKYDQPAKRHSRRCSKASIARRSWAGGDLYHRSSFGGVPAQTLQWGLVATLPRTESVPPEVRLRLLMAHVRTRWQQSRKVLQITRLASHAPHSARVSRPSSSCSPAGPGQATVADCLSMLERLRCHQAKGKFTSTARIIQSTWLLTHHNRQLFSQLPYCRLSMNQAETESPLNGFTKTPQRNGSISPSFMHSLKDTDPQLLDGQFKPTCCWSGVLPSMPGFLVVTLSMITISALLGLRSLSYRS